MQSLLKEHLESWLGEKHKSSEQMSQLAGVLVGCELPEYYEDVDAEFEVCWCAIGCPLLIVDVVFRDNAISSSSSA